MPSSYKLRKENAKLRQIIEENARRKTENNELKSRVGELERYNTELENRVAMLEQGSLVAGQSQHDNSSNNNSSNFNSVAEHHERSLEDVCSSKQDREADDYSPKEPANVPDSAHSLAPQIEDQEKLLEDREMDAFLIETHKKSISNSSTENSGDIKRTKSHLEDVKTVTKCHDQNDVISKVSVLDESDTTSEILESENQIIEGLVQELTSGFSSASLNEDEVDISETSEQDMVPGSAQSLSDLFDKAIKTGQKQILCWFYYSLEFENKVRNLTADGKIKEKTARSTIYKEMKPFLPTITDVNLRKKTGRARKILKLFGEGGVGIDRIQDVTYSASAISGLKDTQIQHIIGQVTSKTVTKSHDHTWSKGTSDTSGEKLPDDLDGHDHRDRAEVSVSTIPIHQPNNPIHDQAYFRNKVLKLYPDIHLHRNAGTDDIYRCRTKSSLCPSCGTNHD